MKSGVKGNINIDRWSKRQRSLLFENSAHPFGNCKQHSSTLIHPHRLSPPLHRLGLSSMIYVIRLYCSSPVIFEYGLLWGFLPLTGVAWWGLLIGLRLSLVRCIKKEHDRTCNMFPSAVGQDKGMPMLKHSAATVLKTASPPRSHLTLFQPPPPPFLFASVVILPLSCLTVLTVPTTPPQSSRRICST